MKHGLEETTEGKLHRVKFLCIKMIYVHPRLANQHQAIICPAELTCQIIGLIFGRGLLISTMVLCPSQSRLYARESTQAKSTSLLLFLYNFFQAANRYFGYSVSILLSFFITETRGFRRTIYWHFQPENYILQPLST